MNEEEITELLRSADPLPQKSAWLANDLAETVRRRAHRLKRHRRVGWTIAAAIVVTASAWSAALIARGHERAQAAALEARVRSLEIQIQESQRTVDALKAQERDRISIRAMEEELAAIGDPLETLDRMNDQTAFFMVYEADRLYHELNLTGSAVQAYKRVIELFPGNRWARVASERLAEIGKGGSITKTEKET